MNLHNNITVHYSCFGSKVLELKVLLVQQFIFSSSILKLIKIMRCFGSKTKLKPMEFLGNK